MDSCSYVAQYVTKKLTNAKDEWVKNALKGKTPEFARMSNRPGIGLGAIKEIAEALKGKNYGIDVPYQLKIAGRNLPIGRYLISNLRREVMGNDAAEKLKDIRVRAYTQECEEIIQQADAKTTKQIQKALTDVKRQAALNQEAWFKIMEQKSRRNL